MILKVGLVSLSFRQTNCVWIALITASSAIRIISSKENNLILKRSLDFKSLTDFSTWIHDVIRIVISYIPKLIQKLWPFLIVFQVCFIFLIWNGGIVLGNKPFNYLIYLKVTKQIISQLFTFLKYSISWCLQSY